jgi:hypothetical protein
LWNFWNWSTSSSNNPYSKDFTRQTEWYIISLKVTDKNSNTDTAYFYVNFIENTDLLQDFWNWDIWDTNSQAWNLEMTDTNSWITTEDETSWDSSWELLWDIIFRTLEVKYLFQSPTYLIESENSWIFNCDKNKEECKANFDFRNTFTWELSGKEGDFTCLIDFGFETMNWREQECNLNTKDKKEKFNPGTITFPIWEYEVKTKITNKTDENYFWELIFTIINDWQLVQSTSSTTYITTYSSDNTNTSSNKSQLNLSTPIIKIQSWLDSKNECNKEECKVNFIYEPTEYKTTEITCKWDFGEWIAPDWAEDKCNPTYVNYLSWKHKVQLEVCDKNYETNCKNKSFEFENIYGKLTEDENQEILQKNDEKTWNLETIDNKIKEIIEPEAKITLQWRLSKNKNLDWNKLVCFWVESCSVNFTWENSIWEKLTYFWDFWNGQTFSWKNPTSMVFEKWEYTTILEIIDKNNITKETYFDIIVQIEDLEKYVEIDEKDTNTLLGGNLDQFELKTIENVDMKIEIQWKIGQNKRLNWNELTCIKTCSINFDWSKSEWELISYFWDFWNGETFEWKNPWYVKYDDYWEYIVLLAGETKSWDVYEKEFIVNFIEKEFVEKEEKTKNSNLISLETNSEDDKDILIEFWWIDYNENVDEDLKMTSAKEKINDYWKYIILSIIIFTLIGIFVLLKKYKLF